MSRDTSFNELLNRYNRLLEALHFIRDYQGDPRNPVYTLQTVRARAGAVIEQETAKHPYTQFHESQT